MNLLGDTSILTRPIPFSTEDVVACIARTGLLSFELQLSNAAHCDCATCEAGLTREVVLSLDEICDVIRQAKEIGARHCIVVDSGTSLNARLVNVLDELNRSSLDVELYAAGDAIDDTMAEQLAARDVAVSLVELDELSLARLTKRGIRRLAVQLYFRQISSLPAIWRRLRNSSVEPQLHIAHPKMYDEGDLTASQMSHVVTELIRIDRDEFRISWPVESPHAARSNMRHRYACRIASCGMVYASADLPIPMGSVRTETLRDILSLSEVLENIRDYRTKVKEPCRTCSQSVDCYGSRGAAYALTGDYLAGDPLCERAESAEIASLPVPIAGLVPHGRSIRMVDELVAVGERRAWTSYTVPADSQFVDEMGRLDETAYVEMIAQSFAASHGFHLSADERPLHRGLLIGIKDLTIVSQAVVGDRLRIGVHKVTRFGDFGVVDGTVHHEDGRLLAAGQIKVWRPSDEQAKAIIP